MLLDVATANETGEKILIFSTKTYQLFVPFSVLDSIPCIKSYLPVSLSLPSSKGKRLNLSFHLVFKAQYTRRPLFFSNYEIMYPAKPYLWTLLIL